MPIRFLSPQDAQKVAAGEVVERPANIIKELMENSIDAGATHIEVAVKQGGKTSLRITDTGTGMSPEDARLCFERHATSKLFTFNDLPQVSTFGFRGEALASVCAVAKVTLVTKQQGELAGLQLTIQEGNILSEKSVAAPVGTTFLVDELFYNIPARKKFLKATVTEWNQIVAVFKSFCLTYPEIHFTLHHDELLAYNCPPVTSTYERIGQLFDPIVVSNALTLSCTQDKTVSLNGAITTPHYSRYDRGGFYFFVNKRLVKNYQLARAVMKGFCNVLPANKYPFAVIHLEVDPLTVDVNVHPKKEEVLFLHPHLVEQAITKAVTETLERNSSKNHTSTAPQGSYAAAQPQFLRRPTPAFDSYRERMVEAQVPAVPFQAQYRHASFPSEPVREKPPLSNNPLATTQKDENLTTVTEPSYRIVGQLHKTYLLLEQDGGLLVIDQHAAHERILYERFGKNFGKTETVQLLFPLSVFLASADLELLVPHLSVLHEQGICAEQFGQDQLRITAVPVYAKQIPLQELIHELLGWIKENETAPAADLFKTLTEKMRAQLACKAAVKAGDVLTLEAMEQLLRDLETTERRFSCPHGRPTQWLVQLSEIERKFKRIV